MTREEIAAFVDRHMEAFRQQDPELLASQHAFDGTVVSPMFATKHGRKAIEESYDNLFAIFPDWSMTVDDVIIDPPRLAMLFKVTATHVNDFFGLPGTHKRFDISGARYMTFENGLIKYERRIYDFTRLLVELGVLRAKPAKL